MLVTHRKTILKYDEARTDARKITGDILPNHLKGRLKLKSIGAKELAAFSV